MTISLTQSPKAQTNIIPIMTGDNPDLQLGHVMVELREKMGMTINSACTLITMAEIFDVPALTPYDLEHLPWEAIRTQPQLCKQDVQTLLALQQKKDCFPAPPPLAFFHAHNCFSRPELIPGLIEDGHATCVFPYVTRKDYVERGGGVQKEDVADVDTEVCDSAFIIEWTMSGGCINLIAGVRHNIRTCGLRDWGFRGATYVFWKKRPYQLQ